MNLNDLMFDDVNFKLEFDGDGVDSFDYSFYGQVSNYSDYRQTLNKTEIEQYRSKIKIVIGSDEWNDTMNPSYDSNNTFIKNKYISEIAITDKDSDKPLIYAKIAPPIRKVPNLDIVLSLSIDY